LPQLILFKFVVVMWPFRGYNRWYIPKCYWHTVSTTWMHNVHRAIIRNVYAFQSSTSKKK